MSFCPPVDGRIPGFCRIAADEGGAAVPPHGPRRDLFAAQHASALLASYAQSVEFDLAFKPFSRDMLLIRADAGVVLQEQLELLGCHEQAREAGALVERLRAEAPHRHIAPLCLPLTLLDRIILVQAHAQACGERITSGEAAGRAACQEADEAALARRMHVSGGQRI